MEHDSMFHQMKGVHGNNTTNHSPIKTPFTGAYAEINIDGIDISYVQVRSISNVNVYNLHSQTGSVSGIRLNPGPDATFSESIDITNLYAGSMNGELSNDEFNYGSSGFPNNATEICGIKNNDSTHKELSKANCKSTSPVHSDIMSISSSCLRGKVGCSGS